MKNQLLFNFTQSLFRKMSFRMAVFAVLTLLSVQHSFAQQWTILANEGQISSVISSYTSIAVVDDVPYVAYVEATGSGVGKVKKLDAGSWVQVGTNLGANISFTRIFKDKTGKLYVTYIDNGSSSKLAVKTFDGTDWVQLGSVDQYVSTGSATHGYAIADIRSDLAFDSANVPYVTFSERTGTTAYAYVKRFIGGAWETVGGAAVSADSFTSGNGITLDSNDVPYVVYIMGGSYTSTSGTVKTLRYNGAAWVDISSASPVTGGSATTGNITVARNTAIAMDSANNPLVCYYNTNNSNKSTVIRYNGTAWSWLGVNGTRDGKGLSLINDTAGNVYNVFTDNMSATQPTLRVYKQTTPAGAFTELQNLPIITISGSGIDNNSSNTAVALGSTITKPYVVYTKTNSSGVSTPVVRFFDPATKPTPTWNGTAWSDTTVPTEYYDAIVTGAYATAAGANGTFPFKVATLTVNSGGSVTVNTGTNLTIQNKVINNAGANGVVVENNANLVQVNTFANTNAITVNRNSNALYRLDYTMWSSPVASQNLAAFSPLTSQSPSRFYTYTSATNVYTAVATPTATNFASATGYLIRMPNTDPTSGYDTGTQSLSFPGVFTGVPNNGTVTLSGLTSGLFYAVGNPYPSTISAQSFLTGNTITGGVLYFWRKTNAALGSAYATYTNGGATTTTPTSAAPNGTIQVGQGFVVKAGATSITFTNAMREASPTSTQFFRTKAVEKDRIWLNLTNTAGVFSQALVGYMDGATSGVDEGIDGAYINDSPIALTSAINGEEYTIQGRPAFDASDVVALNFKTDVAGDYTIAIDHVDGLFAAGQDVYLVDSATGTETNLKTDAYTFTATTGTANSRFSLKYQKTLKVDAPSFNENSVAVYKNNGTLYVNSGAIAIDNIKVFDIQGRLVAEQKNVNANTTSVKTLKTSQQVLIVKVTSQENTVVNKKVVN